MLEAPSAGWAERDCDTGPGGTVRMATVGVGGSEVCKGFDRFAHAVLAGTTPQPDGEDGLRDRQVVDAGYRAVGRVGRVDL